MNACGPLLTIIITLNILITCSCTHENYASLPDRLQKTDEKLAKAEAQIQETALAHEKIVANFKQTQQDFDTTTAGHIAKVADITTQYRQEKDTNSELFSEVQILRETFTTNTSEIEQLQAENKRLNIRLISPQRKIRRPPPNPQSIADKEELAALKIKFRNINETINRLAQKSNNFNRLQYQSTEISKLKAECETKDGKINELEKAAEIQTATISKLEKAAELHTTNVNSLKSTIQSQNKEIEILKQRPTNNSNEATALNAELDTGKSTIATLKANLQSATDQLSTQSKARSKFHSNAMRDRIREINDLKDDLAISNSRISTLLTRHTADLAQKETEKVSAFKDASDLLARTKEGHTTTLLFKGANITTLKTELANLRESFDPEPTQHKQNLTLHFEATKEALLEANTAAVWAEAEVLLNEKEEIWSTSWDKKDAEATYFENFSTASRMRLLVSYFNCPPPITPPQPSTSSCKPQTPPSQTSTSRSKQP